MMTLLPLLLSLAACGDAFETGTLQTDEEHAATWAAVLANPASRAALRSPDVDQRFELADAVFVGKVLDIGYRDSVATEGAPAIPFTFVTWHVEKAWKGLDAGETLTARFMGGVSADGRVLSGSEQPEFALGDRDVVFLDSRLPGACPLVGGAFGRFRLVQGRVYGNDGESFGVGANGLVRVGARDLAEMHVLDRAGTIVETAHTGPTSRGPDSPPEARFFALLDQQFAGRDSTVRPRNADPSVSFSAPALQLSPND